MKLRKLLAASLCSLFGCVSAASVADAIYAGANTVKDKTPSGWTYTVAPFAWLTGLEGDVGVGGNTTHVDESIDDILSNLDIGVMGVGEARYERFGVSTDLVYAQLSESGDTPSGVLARKVDFTTESLMWTVAGEYRLLDEADASIDALGGVRLFSIKNKLELKSPGLFGGRNFSQEDTWADPIVGLKGRVSLTPKIYITGWGLIGGVASSDFVWDLMGGAGYQFTDLFSVVIGYRAAGVDYKDNGFVYDVIQQGPILGAAFRF